ncbi:MAG TPA: acyl carrier protein [Gemmatimonadales bacterium]|nr:acyl carrier protein [Gemmatimonadales bacterium]
MSNPKQFEPRIAALFASKLNVQVPSFDTDLIDTGLVDSLTFVEFLAQLEQEFGIHVSLDDLELDHFRSIARIAGFVATKALAERSA